MQRFFVFYVCIFLLGVYAANATQCHVCSGTDDCSGLKECGAGSWKCMKTTITKNGVTTVTKRCAARVTGEDEKNECEKTEEGGSNLLRLLTKRDLDNNNISNNQITIKFLCFCFGSGCNSALGGKMIMSVMIPFLTVCYFAADFLTIS